MSQFAHSKKLNRGNTNDISIKWSKSNITRKKKGIEIQYLAIFHPFCLAHCPPDKKKSQTLTM